MIEYKGCKLPHPTGWHILIEMDNKFIPQEEGETKELKSQGGIILTEKTVSKENYGIAKATVIAVGKDCYNEKMGAKGSWCKPGDKILLKAHSGRIVPPEDKEFIHGRFQFITDECVVGNYTREV